MDYRLAIDPGDVQWLAGLPEGEGCFWLKKPSGRHSGTLPIPAIKLSMTDYDIVERAAHLMGGNSVRTVRGRGANSRDQYQVDVTSTPAIRVMQAVRPFMGIRRSAKIDEILDGTWARNGL